MSSPSSAWSGLIDQLAQRLFLAALAAEPRLSAAIARFDGGLDFDGADLVFTLPERFRFLRAHPDLTVAWPADGADYLAFRRALYASQLNAELCRHGGIVVVDQAHGEHELTRYRLTHIPS